MSDSDKIDWNSYIAAIWRTNRNELKPISEVDLIDFKTLIGVDKQIKSLCENTERFLAGKAANHCLLWGARGMGKSSLIKCLLNEYHDQGLRVIEIPRDDLVNIIDITDDIRSVHKKFIVFCDDLSFEEGDTSYRALKSSLEGSLEKPPANVLIYATSNRRHFLPEKMSDNLSRTNINGEIHESDAVEEKLSLADRFGLTLSFYAVPQDLYLDMVDGYFKGIDVDKEKLHQHAINFATQKGIRSGRVAKQFYQYYCV